MKSFFLGLLSVNMFLFAFSFLAVDGKDVDSSEDFHFLAFSDMHVSTNPALWSFFKFKEKLIPKMLEYIKKYKVKVFLMPGDLATGEDKSTRDEAAFDCFMQTWYEPIAESLPEIKVEDKGGKEISFKCLLMTCGNHDFDARVWPRYTCIIDFINGLYAKFNPVGGWNEGKGGEMYRYAVEVDGLLFISLGLATQGFYLARSDSAWTGESLPAAGTNEWLKDYLEILKVKEGEEGARTKPIILFVHLPLIGPYCWIKKDVDEFSEIIKGYNIKAIIVGHTHNDGLVFNFHGIPQIDVSGSQFLHATYHPDTDQLDCEFVAVNIYTDGKATTTNISMPPPP